MPNRIIREAILDSARYWSVTLEARQLFFHMLLLADDFGIVSLAPVFVRRRAFDDAPSQAKIDKLIEQLHDADLVRVYEHKGSRYAFVPRFRQTLRIERAKHPMPPSALYQDDGDAKEKFFKNREKFEKLHGRCDADALQPHCTRHAEVKRIEEKRFEEKRSSPSGPTHESQKSTKSLEERAAALGLTQGPTEPRSSFHIRVAAEERRVKATAQE